MGAKKLLLGSIPRDSIISYTKASDAVIGIPANNKGSI